jgi:hypothetical protein
MREFAEVYLEASRQHHAARWRQLRPAGGARVIETQGGSDITL